MLEDFGGSLGLCHFWLWQVELKSLGRRLREVVGIVGNLLADRYRGNSNWNLQNWGPSHWFAPMYSCFLDFLHLFIEKPPKVDCAAEREGRFCKILHWQRPNKDRNFQCHRWALKNYLWLFQVGNFCVLLSKRSTKWCTLRVMFTRVYWEEPWGFTWHACVHRLI